MQTNEAGSDSPDLDLAVNDLGPLAWVLDELRTSLDGASKALRRFVRDAERSRDSDLAAVDTSHLRIARQQLHQAVGALEMVGLAAPAQVLRSMEAAVQKFVERPELCTEDAAAKVERASFALTEYLEGVLNGKDVSPIALFPQYRDVLELAGSDRVHPADLWQYEWRWIDPEFDIQVPPRQHDAETRSALDQDVLKLVKTGDIAAAQNLKALSLALAAGQEARQPRAFWKICAAFFEAVGIGLVRVDVFVKRAASRILLQYTTLARGDLGVSDRLAQDLLFFCSQAKVGSINPAHIAALAAVRQAFGLGRFRPVDYEVSPFGRFDPALLAQARKRITAAKDNWSALAGGELPKLKGVSDQFSLVADSLVKLHPGSKPLAQALMRSAESVAKAGVPPGAELAMEVATSLLFLEAAFEDLDPNDTQLTGRTANLAERLEQVRAGGQPGALEPWMEELYRRVSDRQTMGSVVGELRGTLAELEQNLDHFFRDPKDKTNLRAVPGQLSQMRGVLSVLGLDQASQAVSRMRDNVEEILVTEIDEDKARAAGTFDKLGNNLGALGFLIDMLNYQPALAKRLFIYDEANGELKPLMGRVGQAREEHADASPLSEQARAVVQEAGAGQADGNLSVRLDNLAAHAVLADQPALARSAREASAAVASQDAGAAAQAMTQLAAAAQPPAPAPAVPAPAPSEDDIEEDDLRDIFLEEAREVIQNGRAAVEALGAMPGDVPQLTTLRRAFHTLKGSSRMVGLTEFGEAAWSLEQLFNNWLADQKPANEDLLQLSSDALGGFEQWTQAISAGTASAWKAGPFKTLAESMRGGAGLVPLVLPVAVQPDLPEAAGTVPQPVSFEVPPVEAPESGAATAVTSPAAEPGGSVELDLTSIDFSAPEAASPAPVQAPADAVSFEFELPDFSPAPAAAPQPEPSPLDFAAPPAPSEGDESVKTIYLPPTSPARPPAEAEAPAMTILLPRDAPPPVAEAPAPTMVITPPAVQPQAPSFDMDFAATQMATPPAPQAPAGLPPDIAGIDFGSLSALAGPASAPAMPPAEQKFVDLDAALESELESAGASAPVPDAVDDQAALQAVAARSEPAMDEQVKVIGALRIGIPLYNVYLNEADEWSRRLSHDLSEWALEVHRPVPDSCIALAHSLAGSSATVGFQALSDMARALEHSLQGVQHQPHGTSQQARIFSDAAEDIRRLLHQFAAGFLKEPDGAVLQALKNVEPTDAPPSISMRVPDSFATTIAVTVVPAPASEVADTTAVPGMAEAPPAMPPAFAAPHVAAPVPPSVAVTQAVAEGEGPQNVDDDIDVVDAVDPDLFPIFEEEALELVPRLSGALRQWSARPDNLGARDEVLRALHTLKGSARLAGALRLGEMAHRIESDIERLGGSATHSAEIEPLVAALDAVEAGFESLRKASAQAEQPAARAEPADAMATPVAAQPAAAAGRFAPMAVPLAGPQSTVRPAANQSVRVRSQLLDRLVNQAGEVMITRSRLEAELSQLRGSLADLTDNLDRLRAQLRDIELQAESQMQSRLAQTKDTAQGFDPLEFDRFTRVQELTRMMAESVNDVATVQRSLQRTVDATEDDLIAQARQTRELQRDLLRTRMVEFEGISERLYRVVRQASKDAGKQVKLDITGGSIEMDRGVLDRMTPAFEHLLRNCVAHGIEDPATRASHGKDAVGAITIGLQQEGNDVSVEFRDDGGGLNLARIRERALAQGLVAPDQQLSDDDAAGLVFMPGFSTATQVTELAGRGIGMDVVRSEVNALGGRIETRTEAGRGTSFKLVLPLTTAVTQVVMLRTGALSLGVPANIVETVRRAGVADVDQAYQSGSFDMGGEPLPFFWSGALLQSSARSSEPRGKTIPVVVFSSAGQRIAVHVDEVLGSQEVVVKNLGPQLSRLPGLAGMSVLASGAVVLIYNPVALASVYGEQAHALSTVQADAAAPVAAQAAAGQPVQMAAPAVAEIPLVLVVDDSITVRRVTQRLLQREGYRVALAVDGLQALEKLAQERPAVVLSDIEMPRMDGFDLARNIRGDERLKDLPIVMITSRIAEKHREHAMELGVNHYLGKPYSEEELLSLVKHYCSADALT